jgi:hypothetical protein
MIGRDSRVEEQTAAMKLRISDPALRAEFARHFERAGFTVEHLRGPSGSQDLAFCGARSTTPSFAEWRSIS